MIVPEKMSLSDFVSRRLHPVKVSVQLLKHESSLHSKGSNTEIDKYRLTAVISTLELFVQDYAKLLSATSKPPAMAAGERKFVEDKSSLLTSS